MSAAYRANPLTYMIHRNPARPGCPMTERGMRIGAPDVWMALRGSSRWTLCSRCFGPREQTMLYDQAKAGRPVEV